MGENFVHWDTGKGFPSDPNFTGRIMRETSGSAFEKSCLELAGLSRDGQVEAVSGNIPKEKMALPVPAQMLFCFH